MNFYVLLGYQAECGALVFPFQADSTFVLITPLALQKIFINQGLLYCLRREGYIEQFSMSSFEEARDNPEHAELLLKRIYKLEYNYQ